MSRIDWETVKEDDFNRTVEYLLLKIHEPNAFVLDGRGGDGGIDVAVKEDGKIVTIYQLKHFKEGFSGGFRRSRGNQIKKSFDRAWKEHTPATWILVMPRNPTKGEVEFVEKLADQKDVSVDIWGQGKLDLALGEYPQIERAILRNDVVDLLVQMGQEKAALDGPLDLSERAEHLASLADTRSLHWKTNFTVTDGKAEEFYTPLHARAMEEEPISTTVKLDLGAEHQNIRDKLQQALEYGAFDEIEIPGDRATFNREGPVWVKPVDPKLPSNTSLAFVPHTQAPLTPEIIVFDVIDARGISVGRFEGSIVARASGTLGMSLKCVLANIVQCTFIFPKDLALPGRFNISYSVVGKFIEDVAKAVALSQAFTQGVMVQSYMNGKKAGRFQVGDDAPGLVLSSYDEELIDDLVYLQRNIPAAYLAYPTKISPRERTMIRVGRRILDGYKTDMPSGTELNVVISEDPTEELLERLGSDSAIFSSPHSFILEIQGSKYDLGSCFMYHPSMEVIDKQKVLTAFTDGAASGMEIMLRPTGPEMIQVWLKGQRTQAPDYRGWELGV